jgi:hypothetical protein
VVLWFGRETQRGLEIEAVYRSTQMAGSDIFRIPPPAMRQIIEIISKNGWMIAAQVHSHPLEAFHFKADDDWAIVRHENALSVVVPYFASKTNATSFLSDQKTFRLTRDNRWLEIPVWEMDRWLQIS